MWKVVAFHNYKNSILLLVVLVFLHLSFWPWHITTKEESILFYSFNDVRSLQIHTVLTVGLTQIAASRVGCGFGKDDLVEQGVDGGLEQQRNRWTPTATLHLDQGSSIEAHLICSTQITKTNNTVSHVTFAYSFNDVRSLQIHTVLTVGLTQIAASRVPHFANHGCQNLFQRN